MRYSFDHPIKPSAEIMIYILSKELAILYEMQLTDQVLSPNSGDDDRMQSTTDDEKSGAREQGRVQNARTQWKDRKMREKMHR